jgi:hypothetical protein
MERKGEKKTKTLDILVETYKLMLEEAKGVGKQSYRTENVEPFRELKKAEAEIKDRLKKSFEAELKKPAVVAEGKVIDVYPFDWHLHNIPTWALIEELKNRPGVIFRANTTKEGLVGTFERAPAMVFTVKLPLEGENNA